MVYILLSEIINHKPRNKDIPCYIVVLDVTKYVVYVKFEISSLYETLGLVITTFLFIVVCCMFFVV